MFKKIFLIIIFLILLFKLAVAQSNYYVNYSLGTDSEGFGITPNHGAWKTIEYAINNVSNPTVDEIIINISGEVYDLSNNQIDINRNFANLKLIGAGIDQTIIQAASDTASSFSRVIKVYTLNNVQIENLTVRYGRTLNADRDGGGILNQGTLLIDHCKVTHNWCNRNSLEGGIGGGIANDNGNLTIKNSTISYNIGSAKGQGGGVGSRNGSLDISNSTISYNIGRLTVGGIFVASNGANATFNMVNCTVYGNTAIKYGGIRVTIFGDPNFYNVTTNLNSCTIFNNSSVDVYGGVGLTVPSNFNIRNTIIAGNYAYNNSTTPSNSNLTGSSGNISITSGGYNIIQSISNITINGATNNGIGLDPLLYPLADNNTGNGTQTCAIAENSPVRDAIPTNFPNGAPDLDQRGGQRNGDYDIGAFEWWPENALPVELSSFEAKLINNKVFLKWRTQSEVNNYGFEIQKSAVRSQGTEWTNIGFVEGNGNSNSPKNYSFTDEDNRIGKFFYRLKQIDNDGQFEYSKILEVEIGSPTKLELAQNYPNPFNSSTKIRFQIPNSSTFSQSKSLVILKVYDLLGNEVATLLNEFKEAGNYEVDFKAAHESFRTLTSGVYIYKLEAGDYSDSKKMIYLK